MSKRSVAPADPSSALQLGGLERFVTGLQSCAVLLLDLEGRICTWNVGAERIHGYAAHEIIGQPLSALHPADDAGRWRVSLDMALAEGHLEEEGWRLKKDGSRFWARVEVAAMTDPAGGHVGFGIITRDASDEHRERVHRQFLGQVTRTLSSSLNYKETLSRVAKIAVPDFADWCAVHLVEDGAREPVEVAVAHSDQQKLEMTTAWARRYPYQPDAPRGLANVLRTGESELYELISEELIKATAVDDEHLELIRALKFRSAMVVPILQAGKVRGALTLVHAESGRTYSRHDLQLMEEVALRAGVAIENARLYTAEQRAREVADTANRTKDEFLATVSHELRTPLTAILGWTRMLTMRTLDEARRARATETIERNALMMAQLVEDLLDVSRIISGKLRLEVASVDVAQVVEAAVETLRPAVDAKDIRVETSFEHEGRLVSGDAARLQQVVWNLVSNAVKFTDRGGLVRVQVSSDGSTVTLSVSDTGRGIDPHFLPHVFDPFRQADAGMSRKSGGLGLGLAITKHLVELHGGSVDAASAGTGSGATFRVRLPVGRSRPSHPALALPGSLELQPLPRLDDIDVLVVDDEPDARALVDAVLTSAGASVRTAASVVEAIGQFDLHPPHVLISDIGMPDETGYDLIAKVRARASSAGGNVPAAALTAYARAEDRRQILSAGYMTHITKPVDPAELATIVVALARMGAERPR